MPGRVALLVVVYFYAVLCDFEAHEQRGDRQLTGERGTDAEAKSVAGLQLQDVE